MFLKSGKILRELWELPTDFSRTAGQINKVETIDILLFCRRVFPVSKKPIWKKQKYNIMTLLVIHNPKAPRPDITKALHNCNCAYMETDGLDNAHEFLMEKPGAIHAIVVNYGEVIADKSFLKKLAENESSRDIPLILTLNDGELEKIQPFRHTASYHWLEGSFSENTLYSLVLGAENEYSQRRALRREIHSRESVIGAITRGTFRIKTFEQAEALTTMLSLACPDPDRVAFGLFELLANGIEHGNLEISHEEKGRLMEQDRHREEIRHRLSSPEYGDRYVEITFERESNLVSFKIEDQGPGFDYHDYQDRTLTTNTTHHGRGIALARATSFDYLEFLGNGNKVLAITKFTP
ncbi:hypothetical protein MNBD_ALPHA01-1948 [hydrothermal vent metagenome]|uniref:Histidine kinase/HSP90-like ATPase domain-containing protein n=1 Tax=hydrothermal vent metagenome TaxID=652676 RepID=A0A3B0REQ1_9ZZZZ